MKISILLPYKENFAPNYAGAVSLFVNDTTRESTYKKTTHIFGNTKYKKYLSTNYTNLFIKKNFFLSTNKQYVENFLLHEEEVNSDLIEVHNRPSYIKIIRKKFNKKLFLYFHNDPLQMNGSRLVTERIKLLNNVDKILFNSEWSRKRFFLDFYNNEYLLEKTAVCFQSSSKVKIDFNKKKNYIFCWEIKSCQGL